MGYCIQPPILVYEFMEEGSLHDKLFKTVSFENNDHANELIMMSCILSAIVSLDLAGKVPHFEGCMPRTYMASRNKSPYSPWRYESVCNGPYSYCGTSIYTDSF